MNLPFILQSMRDRAASFAPQFGLPTVRNLIVCKRWVEEGSRVPKTEYLQIDPKPYVEPSRHDSGTSPFDTEIREDTYSIQGISRKYSKDQIVGTGISYWLDAEVSVGRLIGGFECEFVKFDESNALGWELTLRKKPDERRGM